MTRRAQSLLFALLLAGVGFPLAAAERSGFELSVLVDGVSSPEYAARGRVYIEALRGRNFEIRLHNPLSERVAVAISVDGHNVLNAKRTSASDATKFILYPGQTVEIPGWQISGETARRFFFTETPRSYARWLGDTSNVGTIEAVFFREKMHRNPPIAFQAPGRRVPLPGPKEEDQAGMSKAPGIPGGASGAGTYADSAPAPAPPSRAQAEARAVEDGPSGEASARDRAIEAPQPKRKTALPSESDRFAATGIGDRTSFPVRWIEFEEDPSPAARIALRYEFRPALIRLGVLPREDDLYARDRARGFEPEYAPDPYRHR